MTFLTLKPRAGQGRPVHTPQVPMVAHTALLPPCLPDTRRQASQPPGEQPPSDDHQFYIVGVYISHF